MFFDKTVGQLSPLASRALPTAPHDGGEGASRAHRLPPGYARARRRCRRARVPLVLSLPSLCACRERVSLFERVDARSLGCADSGAAPVGAATTVWYTYLFRGQSPTAVSVERSRAGPPNVNDPSAGSPTETLLRLLLPLNDQVWSSSRQHRQCRGTAAHQSEDLTKSFNR